MNARLYLFSLSAAVVLILAPHTIGASSQDESLRDDVFAMVSTSTILNTIIVLDTSEQTNAFAYSGYIDTCNDSLAKINKSIALCWQAYNDCQDVADNMDTTWGDPPDCSAYSAKCVVLEGSRTDLIGFCADVQSADRYAEPGKTETDSVCDPSVNSNSKACRFVGPWNPTRDDYLFDLCFYDWTADSGADIPNKDDYSYSQYPNPYSPAMNDAPDRRDWKCLSDDPNEYINASGLWLNWKFATSLDAMKIILTDDHRFAYAPTRRGATTYACRNATWRPNDPAGAGKCWEWFNTVTAEGDTAIRDMVKANWQQTVDPTILCQGGAGEACDTFCNDTSNPAYFNAVPDPTPAAIQSDPAVCDTCVASDTSEMPCDLQIPDPHTADLIPSTLALSASNLRSACRVFHCTEPKCRDDLTCSSGGCGALGAYSEWDQDINHCCSPIGPGGFECVEGGGTTPTFMPGPGATVSVEKEADFDMIALDLGAGQYYAGVEMTTASFMDFKVLGEPARLDNAKLEMFYGCRGETASIKFFENSYTSDIVANLPSPLPLGGCDTKGYKVRIVLWVTHKDDADGLAAASLSVTGKLAYNIITPSVVMVFNPALSYYQSLVWEPLDLGGATQQLVKEYECKTIFYSMRSVVAGSCPGVPATQAGYPACLNNSSCTVPYPGCTHAKSKKISGGCDPEYMCTWLCPDAPQYDDVWKCMGFFEQNDSLPYPGQASGPGEAGVTCSIQNDSVYDCCASLNNDAGSYAVFKTFDSNYYKDLTSASSGTYKCGMSSVTMGNTSEGPQWNGGVHVEITKGHINEVSGGSYLLSSAGDIFKTETGGVEDWGPTPYAGDDKWYSALSLPNFSGSAIASSFVSVFKTGENGTRDPACIYDIVQDLFGEDCDTCGAGCCTMDMGDINYCDYPTFWIKVAKTEGGNLLLPATSLVGPALDDFREKVIALKGVGGSALAETLYDVWRYIGGLKPAYTDSEPGNPYENNYPSPIVSDPQCFINNVIVISGGQPNFDSNTTMDGQNFNVTDPNPLPTVYPYVKETNLVTDSNGHTAAEPYSTTTPPESRPYYVKNWYLTALPEVANFVHTVDAYHSKATCRNSDPANYRFGLNAAPCAAAADTSGTNIVNRIDTVGIGNWTLAPIYSLAGNETGYLDPDETLADAATKGGGNYYGLTAKAAGTDGNAETFENLSSLFNTFAAASPGTKALGKPHFTSSPVQISGKFLEPMNNTAFLTGAVPVSHKNSRFWFGNLKKYYLWQNNDGKTCILGETALTAGATQCDSAKFTDTDVADDCYNSSTTDISATDSASDVAFNKVLSGGVAKNLGLQLAACAALPCYQQNTGRTIYYDKDANPNLIDFKTKAPADLLTTFYPPAGVGNSNDIITILDYVYGYDSVNHDGDTGAAATMDKRSELAPLVMSDPSVLGETVTIPYSILGAIVHSEPLAIYYGDTTDANLRVYVGANDGLLHAFDGVEGGGSPTNERWAYMPSVIAPEMDFILSGVDAVMFNSTVDGPLTLFHIDDGGSDADLKGDGIINGGEKAYLIIGYRRGINVESGSGYYTVLDISDKDTPKFVRHIAISGQSWSKPAIFLMGGTYYLAFGGGYDPCFDADVPNCASPKGAQIHLYAYNGTTFNLSKTFTSADNSWLVAPIAAEAAIVNTAGQLIQVDGGGVYTGDTEMLYFVDITGTIFRVYHDGSAWQVKTVMAMRATAATALNFTDGIRSYHSFLLYPPFNQYLKTQVDGNNDGDLSDAEDVFLVPIPLLTGNLTNPKEQSLQYEIVVLYDRLPNTGLALPASPDPALPAIYSTASTEFLGMTTAITVPVVHSFFNGAAIYTNLYRGYRVNLGASAHEKGMAAPLVYYNWDYDSYTILATTYRPDPATVGQCGNSGTSSIYARNLLKGDRVVLDDRYAQLGLCDSVNLGQGLASSPKITFGGRATNDEMITASAGSDVYTFSRALPPPPKTVKILKWYELY